MEERKLMKLGGAGALTQGESQMACGEAQVEETGPSAGNRTLRARFHAWALAKAHKTMHETYGDRKKAMFGDLKGTVLEVGPGPGTNFSYYPKEIELLALEPNPFMHSHLRRQADAHGLKVDIRSTKGEQMDVPNSSVDFVVGTLVMCSVSNQRMVIAEVLRALKPGGKFLFIEHVAAARGTRLRRGQNLVRRPWRWLSEGCMPNRETWSAIESGGFAELELERFRADVPMPLVSPHIAGVATKGH